MTHPPSWLRPLVEAMATGENETCEKVSRSPVPAGMHTRPSAVLVLFGSESTGGAPGGDLLLIERAHTMRRHAGQMAFPGGAIEPGDAGPVAAALREAAEETGLEESAVAVFGTLPPVFLPQRASSPDLPPDQVAPGGFLVAPVLGWWRTPCEVRAADQAEVASVHRVSLAHLTDPANRLMVRHPSGYVGPAFRYGELLVWGFTAGLIDRLLRLAGWERTWRRQPAEELPAHLLRLSS